MATTTTTQAAVTSTSGSFTNMLGAGSGVDVKALATNLTEAEKAPQKKILDNAITQSQATISGFGAVLSSISALKTAFSTLQDLSKVNSVTPQSNAQGYFDVTASSAAAVGSHQINVLKLARPQRSISAGFAAATTPLNNGNPFTIDLAIGANASQSISVSTATPAGVVAAINAAKKGVTAQLVNTGSPNNPYTIVLTSDNTGAANAFTASTTAVAADGVSTLLFPAPLTGQDAVDAYLQINGQELWRSTNTVSDVISGVTLKLLAPTSTDGTIAKSTAGTLLLTRDTSSVKTNLQSVVTAFNAAKDLLNTVSDSKSTVATTGATLVNHSLVRQIRMQIDSMVTGNSSTPGSAIKALRDLGLTIQADGKLALDSVKLDNALNTNFSQVAGMLTANAENTGRSGTAARGLAGDAVKRLTDLVSTGGPILNASNNAGAKIKAYNVRLTDLNVRMQTVLDRYTKQFAAMDAMVGKMNSLRDSLKSQFDNMSNSNK